ncbi:CheY-P phosphatase CheX [Caloramator mitchellensis]|uniref:CheY-P phosphatase CheX n=1 Tax=Caloramator mitchellensis TaxID=908809 RepID=A0A0R3JSB4_CALMK|nr:chemotaxis protein CheX [Caloramator mitchellensis]KRQ86360.1 CheY-P phosphatase CheX [Caloramator mitchellensis]
MNVEYINPFLESCKSVLQQLGNITFEPGKLFLKHGMQDTQEVVITIGVAKDVQGNFIMNIDKETALKIASVMMGGYPCTELDELSTSAVSELSNMIAGNASTHFFEKGKSIDITPPLVHVGEKAKINYALPTVCVPLKLSIGGTIEMDLMIK